MNGTGDSQPGGARERIDFSEAPAAVDLEVKWIHGVRRGDVASDPQIQVHAADAHTYTLRQSMTVHHEAPFLYLLCGNDAALLLDTGATAEPDLFPLRQTVDSILDSWLAANPRPRYRLVVAHSHGHGDHVAADGQMQGRPDTTLVAPDVDEMASAFAMGSWPEGTGRIDLGGRVLDVLATPGHHSTAVTLYDPWTGWLLTGDTVYPGRLFVSDPAAFVSSLDRLVAFASERPVTALMGGHIEMTRTPGRDHPLGARFQPNEPPLQMTVEQLASARDAMGSVVDRPGVHRFDDFVIFNSPRPWSLLPVIARSLWHRVSSR